ncbi:MAG: ShlB/FhaC/HecB family hemolysin secretion/activation protein [Moorea sp. SIO2B7]|nr:ShlB/FhaC/HecB family hemolysin secretion/activation protein [Moorena sp. SIO2B7]
MRWCPTSRNYSRAQLGIVRYVFSVSILLGITGIAPSYATPMPTSQQQLENRIIAQRSNRNEDRFPQPSPLPSPAPQESETPVTPTPPPPTTPSDSDKKTVEVKIIKVEGSTIFDEKQFNPIIQPLQGRSVTIADLGEVTDKITQLYLDGGYITSRAILVEETLFNGTVEIQIIEGQLEAVEVEGTKRLNPNYIRSRIKLGGSTPLSTAKLENQLRLLRIDPHFENVEASLKSGSGIGQSILVVRVLEAKPFSGSFSVDNYSPPSVGSERLGLNLGYQNLTGHGDQLFLSYHRTAQGGKDEFDMFYRIPVNAMNGTVQLRTVWERNDVVQGDEDLDINGNTELYEISYRQPLIRNPLREFALSLGFTYQNGQTFLGDTGFGFGIGPNDDGISTTSVFKFGKEYTSRDVSGAWALRSLLNFGTGLFDATTNKAPIPDGHFFSWLAQIQRVQVLSRNNFLIIQGNIQLTPDSLLSSQQFVIGGRQSVRGYRHNVRAGDNGFRFSIEDRITLKRDEAGNAIFQLAPFFDVGKIWNVRDNPNTLLNQRFLVSLGVGFLWEPIPDLNIRFDYGYPIIDLDDRGTNAQDDGIYFNINYGF